MDRSVVTPGPTDSKRGSTRCSGIGLLNRPTLDDYGVDAPVVTLRVGAVKGPRRPVREDGTFLTGTSEGLNRPVDICIPEIEPFVNSGGTVLCLYLPFGSGSRFTVFLVNLRSFY